MPNESLSLYISVQSGSSERTLTSLADKTRALDKETQALTQTTEGFAKASKSLMAEQTRLQSELKSSQKVVNDLQKAYDEYGDELSRSKLDAAIEQHAKLKTELVEVNAQLNANRKSYKESIEVIRKGELAGVSGSAVDGPLNKNRLAMGLISGQVGQMLSSSLGGLAEYWAESAFGIPTASLLSEGAGGLINGVLAGSVFGPWGALAGGALGLGSGLLSGGTKILEAKDDAFKDYYNGLYQDVSGKSEEMVSSGSMLASGRQTDRISFKTLFGDEQTANEYLENMVNMANHTPFLYDDLVSMSKTLATYGYSAKEGEQDYILDILQTIGDTGAALGMGTADMTAVAQALGRMKSSDKTTLEYLNILNDRGIGAVGMLAEAKGVDQGKLYDMISKGEISGTEAVEIITAALSRPIEEGGFAGSMLEQSKTFAGISSTLEGLEQELQNAGGDAYNELRKEGVNEQMLAYDGALGDAIKEINAVMGENQARKENLQDQYMREVLDAVLNGNQGELWSTFSAEQQNDLTEMSEKYASLMEQYQNGDTNAGAELASLYEQAQVLGQAYFDNSDEVARLNEIEQAEVDAIRDAITPLETAHQRLYELNRTMSKGLAVRTLEANTASGDYVAPATFAEVYREREVSASRNAFGLSRVPYDEYPALLHEGERVLTAAEARAQDAGTGSPISLTITGNQFTGTPEEMADQLAEIILRKLSQAATAAAPK